MRRIGTMLCSQLMALIELKTTILSPPERVFDLCRSIEFHEHTSSKSGEKAVRGRTSGLIELGEKVTWRARHFGITQELTVRITEFDRPSRFVDEMISGAFATMSHEHRFEVAEDQTVMVDRFEFTAPLGILGRLAEALFLRSYMQSFLLERGRVIKVAAESDEWKQFLSSNPG